MQINVIYDQSPSSLPAGFVAAVNYVVNYFDTTFTNPVTINIDLGYGEIANQSLSSGALGESETFFDSISYSQAVSALKANQPSAAQQTAYATLPGSSPVNGGTLWVSTAQEKALGLLAGNNSAIDGYVGVSNTYPFSYSTSAAAGQYYFDGVLAHEFTEVLSRGSLLGEALGGTTSYSIMDLFRYAAPGVRQLGTGGPAYFSINNGTTNLDSWNTNPSGDLGDWAGSAGTDAFLAFSPTGRQNWITQPDLTLMSVLGWDTVPPTPPAPIVTVSNVTLPQNSVVAASSLFSVSNPTGASPITGYAFYDDSRTASSGEFLLNGVPQPKGTYQPLFVSAAQLSQVTFQAGTNAGDDLYFEAFDGSVASNIGHLQVTIATPPAPVVTVSNVTLPQNNVVAASSLFSVSNPVGASPITGYAFYDDSRTASSGEFLLNGVPQPKGTYQPLFVSVAQLSQVTFQAGTNAGDDLYIAAYDGSVASNIGHLQVTVAAPPAPVVTVSNVALPQNSVVAASTLFSVSNPVGASPITRYAFYDDSRTASSGEFLLNGVAQPKGTYQPLFVSAAQLSQVTFQAGINAGDDLYIAAYDGSVASNIGHLQVSVTGSGHDHSVALLSQYMASSFGPSDFGGGTNPPADPTGTSSGQTPFLTQPAQDHLHQG